MPILSTPSLTFPSRLRTPSLIPSACTLTPFFPLDRYTPVLAPPRLTLTFPKFRFKDGALAGASGGGSYTEDGKLTAAVFIISKKLQDNQDNKIQYYMRFRCHTFWNCVLSFRRAKSLYQPPKRSRSQVVQYQHLDLDSIRILREPPRMWFPQS